ncbi:hypothetical protein [Vibrio vulnificus]|uniref:hypothetical protein n=1 Tax=Vibrio vulnificus TaxID=672 RepID=UPI003242B35B
MSKIKVMVYDRDHENENRLNCLRNVEVTPYNSLDELLADVDKIKPDLILVDLYSSNGKDESEHISKSVAQKLGQLNELRHQVRDEDIVQCWNDSGFEDAVAINDQLNAEKLTYPVAIYSKYGSIISKSKDVFRMNSKGIYWAYKDKSFVEEVDKNGLNNEFESIIKIIKNFERRTERKRLQEKQVKSLKHIENIRILGWVSFGFFAGYFVKLNLSLSDWAGEIIVAVVGALITGVFSYLASRK